MMTAVSRQLRGFLQLVDELHEEVLFIERIGITGVTVLDGARLRKHEKTTADPSFAALLRMTALGWQEALFSGQIIW
jgi:hypothetical protein